MRQLSDRTLCELLSKRLTGVRCFQLFVRQMGPKDLFYVGALGWGADDNVVEAEASAETLAVALAQAIANLELATTPEED